MSDLGLFTTKFDVNQRMLKNYDMALRKLHFEKHVSPTEKETACDAILAILRPIGESIKTRPSAAMDLNESKLRKILQTTYSKKKNMPWADYTKKISEIISKIENRDCQLDRDEISILNDVGDALDLECSKLFRRIRG